MKRHPIARIDRDWYDVLHNQYTSPKNNRFFERILKEIELHGDCYVHLMNYRVLDRTRVHREPSGYLWAGNEKRKREEIK